MEEKTLFKLARAITDTGTDTVSSKGGTITYRITSLKRKLVNGKVVSTSTPSCTLGSASVSWATWKGVTVGDGYLDVKINYSENTGSSRSTTLIFDQDGSGNKINLTVTQESGITYTGYIKMITNSILGGSKGDIAIIVVMAYLNGSDGSKKPETPNVGSAPDWCSVSVAPSPGSTTENNYVLTLTALSNNKTGANRSEHLFLTCGDANLSIPVTQKPQQDSTFTLSGLPTDTGYYLFGKGAKPQNTSSLGQEVYIQGRTTTIKIPFYANGSEPGSLIECTTGDSVAVYTKSGDTWILKGSFIVPSAGGTVSV